MAENIGDVYASFRISDSYVRKDIREIQKLISKMLKNVNLDIRADTSDATKNIEELTNELQEMPTDVSVEVDADTNQAQRNVQDVRGELNKLPRNTQINVEADTRHAKNNLADLEEQINQVGEAAEMLRDALTFGAAGAAIGGVMGFLANGIEDTTRELDRMEERIRTLTQGKIDTSQLELLRQAAKEIYILTGDEIELISNDIQAGINALGSELHTAVAGIQTAMVAQVKGLDRSEIYSAYLNFAKAFRRENPEETLRNFLNTLERAPNVDDMLDTIREYPTAVLSTLSSSAEFGTLLTNAVRKQWNTDKPLDFVKEFAIQLGDAEGAILKTVAESIGSTSEEVIKQMSEGTLNMSKVSQRLLERYQAMSRQQQQQFISTLGISQAEDIGVQGFEDILRDLANLEQGVEQFKASALGIGDRIEEEFEAGRTAIETFQEVWREFTQSKGVQTLFRSLGDIFKQLAEAFGWVLERVSWFLETFPGLSKVMALVAIGGTVLVGILLSVGTALSGIGAMGILARSGLTTLATVFNTVGLGAGRLIGFIRMLGSRIMWVARFVIQRVLIGGLTTLATAFGTTVGVVAAVVAAIAGLGIFIWAFWDELKAMFNRSMELLKSLAPRFLQLAKNIGINLVQGLLAPIRAGGYLFDKLLEIFGVDSGIVDKINSWHQKLENMKSDVNAGELARDAFVGVRDNIQQTGKEMGDRVAELWDGLKDRIGSLVNFGGGKEEEYVEEQKKTNDLLATNLDKLGDISSEEMLKMLASQKTPSVQEMGPRGITPDAVQQQPVNQINNIYNPYNAEKVDRNSQKKKMRTNMSVGRRSLAGC